MVGDPSTSHELLEILKAIVLAIVAAGLQHFYLLLTDVTVGKAIPWVHTHHDDWKASVHAVNIHFAAGLMRPVRMQ